MDKEPSVKKNLISRLDRIVSSVLLFSVLFTPIFFLPLANFPPEVIKKFFLIGTVTVALILWLISRFKEKKFLFVKDPSFVAGIVFLVLTLISSLLSISPKISLIGLGFESDTFLSLTVLFGLMFLVSEYFRSKQKFLNVYLGLFITFAITFIFQVVRLSFGNFLPWIIFDNGAVNLIGKWNDLGVFSGLITLSSVIILEIFPLKEVKAMKNFIWGILTASILTMAMVNLTLIWIVVAVILFVVYIYNISFLSRQALGGRKVIKVSLVVFLISLAFIFGRQPFYYTLNKLDMNVFSGSLSTQIIKINQKLNIATLEVRPNVSGTYSVVKDSFKINPVFGSGPNTFSDVWLKNKPAVVNDSPYWNIEPKFGVGFVPTFFVTTGLLGCLALVMFILLLLYAGAKSLANSKTDSLEKSFLTLSFAGLVYVWAFLIFYVPDTSILIIAFVITGLFIARLVDLGEVKTKELVFDSNPKVKFVSYMSSSVIAILSIFLFISWIITSGSMLAFQRSTSALNVGDADTAEKYIDTAISLNPQDIYYRFANQINVAQMNILISKKVPEAEFVDAYKKIFERAKNNIDSTVIIEKDSNGKAIVLSKSYINYVSRGLFYENVMSLGIAGAYDLAKADYLQSLVYNPHGPDMYLNLARLEIANKNYTDAEKYLESSLSEKKDYLNAIFLQSQLYAQRGFLDSAIQRALYASQLAPSDTYVLFQLGYLQYRNADYSEAVQTLKQATSLIPGFANAQYFLGLSYSKLGMNALAINEFTELQKTNPENTELKQILINLKAGRDPLVGEQPVEKKVVPPVKQN